MMPLTKFCSTLHLSGQIHRAPMAFEEMCSLSQVPRHMLSLIYKEILPHTHNTLPTFTQMWSSDIDTEISLGEWQTSFTFTHKSLISSFTQEKNYKLLSRWYRDPVSVHRMFPNTPRYLLALSQRKRNLHIWWECDQVHPFWKQIFEVYNKMYDDSLALSPKVALLSILRAHSNSRKLTSSDFFLSAARQLIAKFWKSEVTPPPPFIGGLISSMTSC